ncbi:MAG: FadR family transcriptional regulator [Chloroflexi bacterium]|nr:FadR family transcriptional regulator [Chloroflexota bacterium]
MDIQIKRSSLPAQVAEQIQGLIESEALRVGDRLPPERDLAERLGVSRPVIREALQVLSQRGLVAIKPGCGTFIQEPSAQHAADMLKLFFKMGNCRGSLDDFFALRRSLEIEAAGLASQRATEADHAALNESLAAMQTNTEDLDAFIAADLDFHLAVARAAHNEFLLVVLEPLVSIWSQVISLSSQAQGAPRVGISYHQKLAARILERDQQGAREVMGAHMQASHRFAVKVQAENTNITDHTIIHESTEDSNEIPSAG